MLFANFTRAIKNNLGLLLRPVYLLWLVIALLLISLTLYQLRFWITGPQIDIEQTQFTATSSPVLLDFEVHNTTLVEINGFGVIPEEGGMVEYPLYLMPGRNTTAIDLFDKYGGHKRLYLYITYPQ